jgi:spermidine/putrescine transport system permease protein
MDGGISPAVVGMGPPDPNRLSFRRGWHRFFRRRRGLLGVTILSPALAYLVVFFAVPFLITVLFGLGYYNNVGRPTGELSLDHFSRALDPGRPSLGIIGRSLLIGAVSTALCFVIGYPVAYFIARGSDEWKHTLLLLVLIPFWTSFLIRTYALMALMHTQGPLTTTLAAIGLEPEEPLLFTLQATLLGLVYNFLFFMILPLYAAIERFDERHVEAAYSLGARPVSVLIRIILPETRSGIAAGSILVFILTSGEYIVPALMGGTEVYMIAQDLFDFFLGARNWNLGSALSVVLMFIVLGLIVVYMKTVGKEEGLAV